jgi:hypothetical protein
MAFFLIVAVTLSIFTGCGKDGSQDTSPTTPPSHETTDKTIESPSQEPTATPEPGPKIYTPADIRGSAELNPFFEAEFPDDFVTEGVAIKTAGWGGEGESMRYITDILAPMDNESVLAMLNILGIEDKDTVSGYIETLQSENLLEIDGYGMDGVMDCVCKIYMTPKENGWAIRLTSLIDEQGEADYYKFIEDNYNMNLFASIKDIIPLLSVGENFIIEAFYIDEDDLMQTSFEAAYPFEDLDAVLQSTLAAGGYSWYDSDNKIMGIDYGTMSGKIWFSTDFGMVNVTQTIKGVPDTPMSEYLYEPVITMEDYGFGFSTEGGMSVYENHGGGYSSLAFCSSDWDAASDIWAMEFCYPFKNGNIFLTYHPEDNLFKADMNSSWGYHYDTLSNIYTDFYPDKETVEQNLSGLYADREPKDLYLEIFRILEEYTLDVTGMSFDEFVALPPAQDYPPLNTLPVLPKPEDVDLKANIEDTEEQNLESTPEPIAEDMPVTLQSLGFEYVENEGMYWIYDGQTHSDITINKEEWKKQTEEWNKNVVRYYKARDEYNIEIAYYPNDGVFEAHAYIGEPDEGVPQSYYKYDLINGVLLDAMSENIDKKPEELFPEALGIAQTDTIYTDVFAQFEGYTQEKFGMAPDELFALDAQ